MRSVVIIGRPNVGKSALFNRLAGRQISIVHDEPGVTRDRIVAPCKLAGRVFDVVDTGGIGGDPDPQFAEATREAALAAAEGADLILLVVDARDGCTPLDEELADRLRPLRKPLLLVVNKADHPQLEWSSADFARLGIEQVIPVSAAHGRGIQGLVEKIADQLPPDLPSEETIEPPRLAIVGRPNVGKSSLLNALLEEPRALVSEIAGTTRDVVDSLWEKDGQRYLFCDTAGIRHRSKHRTSVEVFSVMRSEKAIERADLCLLVLDAAQGVTAQDKKIASLIQKANKACLIVLNKWDLVCPPGSKDRQLLQEYQARVRQGLFFLDHAPLVITSAHTGESIRRILTTINKIREHARRRIGTGELNRILQAAVNRQPPPAKTHRRLKILYSTQIVPHSPRPFAPPSFLLFVNDPRLLPAAYRNYLIARLRERYLFPGLPIILRLRGRRGQVPK